MAAVISDLPAWDVVPTTMMELVIKTAPIQTQSANADCTLDFNLCGWVSVVDCGFHFQNVCFWAYQFIDRQILV
jgi:hypothetical protein